VCAAGLGRVLQRASDAFIARLWRARPPPEATKRFAARDENFQAHLDLGVAYREMGMAVDAILELAVALDASAPEETTDAAFYLIFRSPLASQEALDLVVAEYRVHH
jgi:hypothetical protein